MDKIIEEAIKLKSSLNETEEFKEYFRLKSLYESSEEVKSLLILLKETPKNTKQYEHILKEYNSHPLVVNYLHAEEEVKSILKVVKDILEK